MGRAPTGAGLRRLSAAAAVVLTLAACTPVREVGPAPTLTPERADARVVLVEPSYQVESMPVSPTWQPDDPVRYLFFDARWKEYLGERPVGEWRLSYAAAKLTLEISGRDLAGHELLHPEVASPPTPVTMLGTTAEMRTAWFGDEPEQFWVWYLTDVDGLSVLVSGTDAGIVERFATGLRREPREILTPFEVGLLPEGFVPMRVDEHAMEFASSRSCCLPAVVSIFLVEPDPDDDRQGTPATIGGNPAEVYVEDGSISVDIGRPDGSVLQVAAAQMDMDEEGILRLAESVKVNTTAVPLRQ